MFRVSEHPSSGVLKTVTAASGTGRNADTATSLQRGLIRYLFTAKLLYMFRMSQHPSSGVLKTVTAASGTGHNTGTATSVQRGRSVHVGGKQLYQYYDLYQRLRVQFLILLMMGAVIPETCRVAFQ